MHAARLSLTLLCGLAGSAFPQAPPAAKPFAPQVPAHDITTPDRWDKAFQDTGRSLPLHFTAHYIDAHKSTHRLEEWRTGQDHLRRLTDDRIDLHADAATHLPGQPREYVWTILDLQKRIAHRISTVGMLRLGMLYSYYSMAHVLTRPAGQFTVEPATAPETVSGVTSLFASEAVSSRRQRRANANNGSAVRSPMTSLAPASVQQRDTDCSWWTITASGQPAQRVCWLQRYGVPARTYTLTAAGWRLDFQIDSLDTRPIAPGTFLEDIASFQVRNVDELETED